MINNDNPDQEKEIKERFFHEDLADKPITFDMNTMCGRWIYWLLQIIVIFSIGFFVSTCISENEKYTISTWPWAVGILCVSYSIYVFFFMNCLDTVKYISNIKTVDEFKEYYEQIRGSKINLNFRATCYHYGSKSKKVTTSINEQAIEFDYYQDHTEKLSLMSGPQFGNPKLIKIAYILTMKLNDQKSFDFYQTERNKYFTENSSKDTYMDFSLIKRVALPEFISNRTLVLIEPNIFVSMFFYILFTYWIPLGTFYLAYLESSFNNQMINIVKGLSIKSDQNPYDENVQRNDFQAPNDVTSQFDRSVIQNEQFGKVSDNFNTNYPNVNYNNNAQSSYPINYNNDPLGSSSLDKFPPQQNYQNFGQSTAPRYD